MRIVACLLFACAGAGAGAAARAQTDSIAAPLTAEVGDAARGRAIVADRQLGLCLLCHSAPIAEERFQGNLAPSLDGAGARWSGSQLRMRMVDASAFNPETIMPSYFKPGSAPRTPAALRGKTILSAQQVEDVVAYLQTLGAP